ncbi:MAG TPA: sensor histidine kinase [Actinomycetota bacterium]|nr:sensor histidine kinase [Actinomycetota bacterium]
MVEQALERQTPAEVAEGSSGRRFSLGDLVFSGFFAGLVLASLLVMGFGLVAVAAGYSPGLHDRLHDLGFGEGVVARVAQGMGDAAHDPHPWAGLAIDYLFSGFNLVLAGILLRLRPRDWTARLLAVGMVGTAAVFNLQAAGVYHAMPKTVLESTLFSAHRLIAGDAYIAALLLFPDGHLIPRWRRPAKLLLYLPFALIIAWLSFRPESLEEVTTTVSLITFFGLLTPMSAVAAQLYRMRHPHSPEERQQSKLLFWALTPALVIGLFVLAQGLSFVAQDEFAGRPQELPLLIFRIFQPVFTLIPVALFIGLLKYRLWNIEKILSRTLAYGVLAAFVGLVYVGVVVGVGRLIGAASSNLALSVLATGTIAVAFQPVREKVERLANRLVYGRRATPYEVLSEFSTKMASTSMSGDLLRDLARSLVEGTGAISARVWLDTGDSPRLAAAYPDEASADAAAGTEQVVDVVHRGEKLGSLSIVKREGEALSSEESDLLANLASQAGIVLRNLKLNAELLERLDELQASRKRVLAAQYKARRQLERDLHDGAQQQLVALKVKLSLAERIATEEKVKGFLSQLQHDADDTLQTLRDLARGIYPPLLAEKGLAVALTAQANKSPLDVTVTGEVGRYGQEVEAAVYFCCLEALQNVAKYAGPCKVVISLASDESGLSFEVRDDGAGFESDRVAPGHGLENMADRMDALGGTLTVTSKPGEGTVVRGRAPVRAMEPVA